ncbi:hypothetical protein [Burkholderia gladioli]|uniref:hypothetical protein n=1 Tax=Burkholderia gladioli TaxID=28095 RepID=UPI003D23AF4C
MGMRIKIEALEKGDEIIGFSENRIAIKKETGELEILTLTFDENNVPRIDERNILITFKTGSTIKSSIVDDSGSFEIGSF